MDAGNNGVAILADDATAQARVMIRSANHAAKTALETYFL